MQDENFVGMKQRLQRKLEGEYAGSSTPPKFVQNLLIDLTSTSNRHDTTSSPSTAPPAASYAPG
jgi:hypothetical protein